MIIRDRWYQIEAADSVCENIIYSPQDEKIADIVVAPPGTGKSIIPCRIIDEYLTKYPEKKVLVASHVVEILEQNHEKLVTYFEGIPIGLYNAELGLKQVHKITVVGIHSCYKNPEVFGDDVGLIIIDECHLVGQKETGMYRKFLKHFDCHLVGLTATPWVKGVLMTEINDPIFKRIAYDISEYEKYNRLIEEGFLIKLIPLPTDFNLDEEGVKIVNGDFDEADQSAKFDLPEVTEQMCKRIVKYGRKYKKWLLFAIDKKHADHIANELIRLGVKAEAVYTGSARGKVEVLGDLRRGELRAVVNVGMLTTGVDVPEIDLIAFCRLTKAPVFWVQSNGRGTRPVYVGDHDLDTIEGRLAAIEESGKTHTLVLDFGRNARRLGPINGIKLRDKKDKKGVTTICAKQCKNCGAENHLRAVFCDACDTEFLFEVKLKSTISNAEIMKTKESEKKKVEPRWLPVTNVEYEIHTKPGSPNSLKVIYTCKLMQVNQFICIDHLHGAAVAIARQFVKNRYVGSDPAPKNLKQLWEKRWNLKIPSHVQVKEINGFMSIVDTRYEDGVKFAQKPKESTSSQIVQKFMEGVKNKPKLPSQTLQFDDDIPF